ncbi:hypothetical protein AKJ09_08328 [Labilithrix luteola]|uniref:Ribbon-helix-helix protein CopG domain-containing protein n=1 Tax=Labilithrix luteola TaxID=1391654 RepID=A0A0K1Q8D5_9BACT|nr:hypothetical protein AKJ09_08328 [Labilithrix luteola]
MTPSDSRANIALDVPAEWLADADAIAAALARPGFTMTRSDVLRASIAKGLEAFRVEAGLAPTSAAPPAPTNRPLSRK